MKKRQITERAKELVSHRFGRITIITGARQVGKTTLVRKELPDYKYISIEDPAIVTTYKNMTAAQWNSLFPQAALDEIQKEPTLIETIKAAYDQYEDCRYILLGSSQIRLLEKVRESLAGRCSLLEMFPLTLPELETNTLDDKLPTSLWQQLLSGEKPELLPSLSLHPRCSEISKAWNHLTTYGGYPAISDEELTDNDRFLWLTNYVRTYLERDIRDLANIRDLEPFVRLQQIMALRTGGILNANDIANEINVSVKTVQRFIQYLEISYQTLRLPAWFANKEKRLVKSPKLHMLDYGVTQAVLKKRGGMTGAEFESIIISELYKQAKNAGAEVSFYHLRTPDGMEVDLLVEMQDGFYAFEVKQSEHVTRNDARHLLKLPAILNKPVIHSFILSNDVQTQHFGENITAVSAQYFLG